MKEIKPLRNKSLTKQELYLFDTVGVLKISDFLSKKDVETLSEIILSCPPRVMAGRGDKIRYDNIVEHSAEINNLAQSESILLCVEPLINQPFRIIESYGLFRQGNSIFYLHNGMSEYIKYNKEKYVQRNMSFAHTYHNGKLYCMFIKCILYLTDINTDEDGPFCYIEGSHKANFPLFDSSIDESEKLPLNTENFPSLKTIHVKSGDVLLLNEALLHGTLPKVTNGDRLLAALSYAPCFISDWKAADISTNNIHKIGHF